MWRRMLRFMAPMCVVAPLLILACSSAKDSAKFANNAAQGGLAEDELGRLAAQKADDPSVRQFGQRMIADHSRAGAELKSLAAKKGMQLPNDLTSAQKTEMERLSKLARAEVDKQDNAAMSK